MNKLARRITALCLCLVLCLGCVCAALAANTDRQEQPAAETDVQAPAEQTAAPAAAKDETVYVLTQSDGSVRQIIVSDWLQNASGGSALADRSELSDLENVKGKERFSADGAALVWDAQGNDIYYQGTTEKELPVTLRVSYTLDGQPVTPQELAGKSGRVTIRFDYENRQYETVTVNGRSERVLVPFAVLTGVVLDNDIFRNVEVTNGQLINDGDRSAAVGLALPGLREELGLTREQLDLPEYVEICADAVDFQLGMTVTAATSEFFRQLDEDSSDLLDADGALDGLTDAMAQLLDGSGALYDGLCALLDSTGTLAAGADQLTAGAKSLRDGAASLNAGAAQLDAGLGELSGGLDALSANSAALTGGAAQMFDALLASACTQIRAAGLTIPDLTRDNYAQTLDGVLASLEQAGAAQAAQTVAAVKASLDSCNTFYQGLCSYTAGVDSAAAGSSTLVSGAAALKQGAGQLDSGAQQLYTGAQAMQSGMPQLTDGVQQLRDGALALSDGLTRFNEQGVQKLADLLDGETADRLRAVIAAAKNYRNFSGIADDTDGQVKFIYRTDEIRTD